LPATPDADLKRETEGATVSEYRTPEEAVVVGDLHLSSCEGAELPSCLMLELNASLIRERHKEDALESLETRHDLACKTDGEIGLAGSWRGDHEQMSLVRRDHIVVIRIRPQCHSAIDNSVLP
jgi:hypothetical protein